MGRRCRGVAIRGLRWSAVALAVLALSPIAAAAQLAADLAIGSLRYPGIAIDNLRLNWAGGAAELRLDGLQVAGREWRDLALTCAALRVRHHEIVCESGRLQAPAPLDGARLAFSIAPALGSGNLTLTLPGGGAVAAAMDTNGELTLAVSGLDPAVLIPVLPQLADWQLSGALECRAQLWAREVAPAPHLACTLRRGGFTSGDGLRAAEDLELDLTGSAAQGIESAEGWQWQLRADWRGGAIYIHPVYLPAGATLAAAGELADGRLRVTAAALQVDDIGALHGSAVLGMQPPAIEQLRLQAEGLDLETLGRRVLAPLALPAQSEALKFSGRAAVDLQSDAGRPWSLGMRLVDAGVEHRTLNMGLGPVNGVFEWPGDGPAALSLQLAGVRWRGLVFGAFPLQASVSAQRVAVEPLAMPLFDGALRLQELELWREGDDWQGMGRAAIDPISLPELSAAAELPIMGGSLAADLPRVHLGSGEIAVDGEIAIAVFDGSVRISGLRLIEPFGVGAYARAALKAERLDLGLLTDSFDFGNITGRVDVRVRDLELAGWRPVRFAARVESSPGRYARRISQRAVQNLGALGGPGVVNAIQRSALRFFDSFGYRRIGWSSTLTDGVCEMDGIEPGASREDGGFVIVEGRGIPALDVVGYNRRVDWEVLLGRLQRVTGAGSAVVR